MIIIDSANPVAKFSTLNKGLVGHWRLDKESFNPDTKRFTDKTPYSNHGTGIGTQLGSADPGFQADRMGQLVRATIFNGTDDRIDLNKDIINDLDTTATISFWIKPGAYIGNYTGFLTTTNPASKLLDIWRQDEIKIYSAIDTLGSGGQTYFTIPQGELEGNWHQLVLTLDGTNGKTYWNNTHKTTIPYSAAIPTATSLQIAAWNAAQYDNSTYDDVRIYNRVLTSAERTLLYESYRVAWKLGT